jgi:hypothetical protein
MDRFKLRPDTEIHTHAGVHKGAWENESLAVRIYKPDWGMPSVTSEELSTKYPQLAEHLGGKRLPKDEEITVGEILIDPKATLSTQLLQSGIPIGAIARRITEITKKSLHALAVEARTKGTAVSEVDFFVGISRLASATDRSTAKKPIPSAAKTLGFEIFSIDEHPNIPETTSRSEDLAKKVYMVAGVSERQAANITKRRRQAVAVMSKQRLIELYGSTAD